MGEFSNSQDSSVTACAIIPKDLKHFATNIDNDFIDFGGVERGPDDGNCCSQLLFWNSTFFAISVEAGCSLELRGVSSRSRRCQAASKEVPRGQGKPRAPERWPESSGRGLDDDFPIEALSCQVWSFSVQLGRLQVAPGGMELGRRRSQDVRGSLELQNGGLRALLLDGRVLDTSGHIRQITFPRLLVKTIGWSSTH